MNTDDSLSRDPQGSASEAQPNAQVPVAEPAAPVDAPSFELVVDVTAEMKLRMLRSPVRFALFAASVLVLVVVGLGLWELLLGRGGLPFIEFIVAGVIIWYVVHWSLGMRHDIRREHACFGDTRVRHHFTPAGVTTWAYPLANGEAGECTGYRKTQWAEFVNLVKGTENWLLYPDRGHHYILPKEQMNQMQMNFIDSCVKAHGVKS